MSKEAKPYLASILAAIDTIVSYLPDNEEAFASDGKSQDAILMRLH